MTASDAWRKVADFYDGLSRTESTPGPPWSDQVLIIWFVVGARAEIDMSGFDCLFDSLLRLEDVVFLAKALEKLGEPELAGAFEHAHRILAETKFDNSTMQTADLPEHVREQLREIGNRVTKHGGLWRLDAKLAELIPKN